MYRLKMRTPCAVAGLLALLTVIASGHKAEAQSAPGHLNINVWCLRTTGQGHDHVWANYALIGPWSDGNEVHSGTWDLGDLNDSGGSDDQAWTGAIANFSLNPGQSCICVVSLVAESDWVVGDILRGIALLADALYPEYTQGLAGPVTSQVVSLFTAQAGTIGTIKVRYDNIGGTIYRSEADAVGPTEDRGGGTGTDYRMWRFNAGRAEYYFGVN